MFKDCIEFDGEVFSACAEVVPLSGLRLWTMGRILRVRGGSSQHTPKNSSKTLYSPRARR